MHFAVGKLTERRPSLALREASHLVEVRKKPDNFLSFFMSGLQDFLGTIS